MSLTTINALSLFSGCGGCSLGLKQAGFAVKLAVDIDADSCETYAVNLGRETLWPVDRVACAQRILSHVQPAELLGRSGLDPTVPEKSELDIIVGGPPCQGFSSAGSKDWADPRNILLKKFVKIVTSLQPTWFIIENVEGLLTAKEGFFTIEAIARFLEAGYWVKAKKVYMEQYGLPQKRKRVFVVGNLEQCQFEFPPITYYNSNQLSLFDFSRSDLHPQLSILDAIGDLPAASESGIVVYDRSGYGPLRRQDGKPVLHHQLKQVNSLTQERINLLAPGATMKDLPKHLQHASFNRRATRRVMDGTPTEKRGGAPNGLKRLLAKEPSLTITSASPREFVHPIENRLLTLRECARLQSFPDWYEFQGSWSSIATQIGNAIPPMFMNLLATYIGAIATWEAKRNSPGRWLGIDATKSRSKSPKLAKMLAELDRKTYNYVR